MAVPLEGIAEWLAVSSVYLLRSLIGELRGLRSLSSLFLSITSFLVFFIVSRIQTRFSCYSSQVKFLLPTQIQNSPPLVPGAGIKRVVRAAGMKRRRRISSFSFCICLSKESITNKKGQQMSYCVRVRKNFDFALPRTPFNY